MISLIETIQGGTDQLRLEKLGRLSTKSTLSDVLPKGTKYFMSLSSVETIEVRVGCDSNRLQVCLKASPRAKLLLTGTFDHGSV